MTTFERARAIAFGSEFVGQESFVSASEIRALAAAVRIGPGDSVLDLCCGTGGPGRLITEERGCDYLGVDRSADSLAVARERAAHLACRFELAEIPPLPEGPFDVVILLETMLAFRDKTALFSEVAKALEPDGRFAFTVEAGPALTELERAQMPAADTVWPIELDDLTSILRDCGLTITWHEDFTDSHHSTATALLHGYQGEQATAALIAAHQCWSDWLGSGRIRKFAVVAEKSTVAEK